MLGQSLPFSISAGCYKITTVFSHAQTVVLCVGCSTVLCQPKGGKARLTEGKLAIPIKKQELVGLQAWVTYLNFIISQVVLSGGSNTEKGWHNQSCL